MTIRGIIISVLAITSIASTVPAQARGFVALGVGVPVGGPAYYYPPPPVYYYPPPPAYYPAPVAAAPASAVAPQQQPCREYQSTAVIDGRAQPTYGTACLQPDGSWRIVR